MPVDLTAYLRQGLINGVECFGPESDTLVKAGDVDDEMAKAGTSHHGHSPGSVRSVCSAGAVSRAIHAR